jgi:hypothetical protein
MAAVLTLGVFAPVQAAAPVVGDIPTTIISYFENNVGSLDNNLMVFTDAWLFADYVTDPDTNIADLDWSFYYDSGDVSNIGNIEINGVASLADPGDATLPGALTINTAAGASYRETDLSPTAGTAPFPDPSTIRTGQDGVNIPGVGLVDDVYSSLLVTYFASDGTDVGMDSSMVYAVDSVVTNFPDTVVTGIPALPFNPESLTGWTFTPGDGTVTSATTSTGTTGSQLVIVVPGATPTTQLTTHTGIWSNAAIAAANLTSGNLNAIRTTVANTVAQDSAAQTRTRWQAASGTQSQDFISAIAENNAADPYNIPTSGTAQYLAYFRPNDLDGLGQYTVAWDTQDNGNSGGNSTRTLSAFETASVTAATYEALSNAHADGNFVSGGFGSWIAVSFGDFAIPLGTIFQDNGLTSSTAGGNVAWADSTTAATGAAAEWAFHVLDGSQADAFETEAGVTYFAEYDVTALDGTDANFPRWRMRNGYLNPSVSTEYNVRGNNAGLQLAIGDGNVGTHQSFFVGPSFTGTPGTGNDGDDAGVAFGISNDSGTGSDGTITLSRHDTNEVGAETNLP